ncbi:DUF6625 family protein [Leuconostoc lactis]|uniref:DUF6625 family protein n=1 Tax=Leuconostoc lactis TaxID=1246 RepID=UPI000A042CDE|nr:DUF6625 family protein [Leuconostoc lactis]ORI85241.1 hypothetical protein BMS94_01805 [Leuconostoc lactis]ORI87130.1 hypothetical protein BMS96_02965 [Leuconostoc lactis]
MANNKAVFIIPHFGKFNNYFQLFLNSVENNPDYNWLIFTDDRENYDFPENVEVHYMEFTEFKMLVQSKFDFKVSIEYPYRIADFRPAFGYIFSEYITNFKFWGYSDSDIIVGQLSHFWNDETLDKIGMLGHATLIRNEKRFREAFKEPINGIEVYKIVFSENKNHSFDEEFNSSINNIFLNKNYKVDFTEYQANTYTKSSNLFLTFFNFEAKRYNIKKEKNLFIYRDGKIINVRLGKGNEIIETEYLYIHFQSRKMKQRVNNYEYYKIIPNSFEDIQNDLTTQKGLLHEKKKHVNLHYFKLRMSNLIKKIRKRVKI